jgi:uncharacterized protein YcfL
MKKYLSFLAVLLIVGCSSTPSIKEMTIRMGSTDSIEIIDLRSVMRNGLLTAQATIKNDSSSNLVSYRFKWLGKNDISIFDDDQAFNENNTNSIISKYVTKNIKFNFHLCLVEAEFDAMERIDSFHKLKTFQSK